MAGAEALRGRPKPAQPFQPQCAALTSTSDEDRCVCVQPCDDCPCRWSSRGSRDRPRSHRPLSQACLDRLVLPARGFCIGRRGLPRTEIWRGFRDMAAALGGHADRRPWRTLCAGRRAGFLGWSSGAVRPGRLRRVACPLKNGRRPPKVCFQVERKCPSLTRSGGSARPFERLVHHR